MYGKRDFKRARHAMIYGAVIFHFQTAIIKSIAYKLSRDLSFSSFPGA